MCGIVGFIGENPNSKEVLIDGLKKLEYRGYDSAGVCLYDKGEFDLVKSLGKVSNLEQALQNANYPDTTMGIAHTRWATHGKVCEANAHPHLVGDVCLVHNGIIENADELKKELSAKGYSFYGQTDSEVACCLINDLYQQCKDPLKALAQANKLITGSFAFLVMFKGDQDLYVMRRNSPLVIGISDHGYYVASDICAFIKYTNKYTLLENDELARISRDKLTVYNTALETIDYKVQSVDMKNNELDKQGYDHYMLKEINEESEVVERTFDHYLMSDTLPDLSKYNCIEIVACGSAMYAGMVGQKLIEKYARVRVNVNIASEFRYADPILDDKTLVIVISQSGETADTLAAMKLANERGIDTLAIVNGFNSSIAREAKYVAYTQAGIEVSVATTKAYASQIVVLMVIAMRLANLTFDKKTIKEKLVDILAKETKIQINPEIIDVVSKAQDAFYLGRGIDYALAQEASLKLKEISYINCNAYAAGELKHGTISLIEEGSVVLAIMSDEELMEKTLSNVKEVEARGANVIYIVREDFDIDAKYVIKVPKTDDFFESLVMILPMQLLAYYVALKRGCEIDQPRNLAKSVTVE